MMCIYIYIIIYIDISITWKLDMITLLQHDYTVTTQCPLLHCDVMTLPVSNDVFQTPSTFVTVFSPGIGIGNRGMFHYRSKHDVGLFEKREPQNLSFSMTSVI